MTNATITKVTLLGPPPYGGSYTSTTTDATVTRLLSEGWTIRRTWTLPIPVADAAYDRLCDTFELEQGDRFADSCGDDLLPTIAYRILQASKSHRTLRDAGMRPLDW